MGRRLTAKDAVSVRCLCSFKSMKRLRMSLFTMYVCVQEEDRELRCSGCEERSVRAHAA